MEARGWGWEDAIKKGYLKAAINPGLSHKLISMEEKESYEDFCGQLRGISDRLVEYKEITRDPKGKKRQPGSSQLNSSNNDAMDWEPSTNVSVASTNRPRNAGQQNSQAPRAKWVTQDELTRRRNTGSCLRCGGDGHFVSNCTYRAAVNPNKPSNRPKKGPSIAAAAAKAHTSTVEEVEVDSSDESEKE